MDSSPSLLEASNNASDCAPTPKDFPSHLNITTPLVTPSTGHDGFSDRPNTLVNFDDNESWCAAEVATEDFLPKRETTKSPQSPLSRSLSSTPLQGAPTMTPQQPTTLFMPATEDSKYAGKTIYDYQVLDCNYELYDLAQHRDQVVIICNVASKCKEYSEKGYTILNTLYRNYHKKGFTILAFPCNQFGASEPGSEDKITDSIPCLYSSVGKIDFPILAKVDVNGDHELPLYGFLKSRHKGKLGQTAIRWNFTYFLINRKGEPVARLSSDTSLEEIDALLQKLISQPPPHLDENSVTQPPDKE